MSEHSRHEIRERVRGETPEREQIEQERRRASARAERGESPERVPKRYEEPLRHKEEYSTKERIGKGPTSSWFYKKRSNFLQGSYAVKTLFYLLFGVSGVLYTGSELVKSGHESMIFSLLNSVYVAFGVMSAVGYYYPYAMLPVQLLETVFLSVWLLAWALPNMIAGSLPFAAIPKLILSFAMLCMNLMVLPIENMTSTKIMRAEASINSLLGPTASEGAGFEVREEEHGRKPHEG